MKFWNHSHVWLAVGIIFFLKIFLWDLFILFEILYGVVEFCIRQCLNKWKVLEMLSSYGNCWNVVSVTFWNCIWWISICIIMWLLDQEQNRQSIMGNYPYYNFKNKFQTHLTLFKCQQHLYSWYIWWFFFFNVNHTYILNIFSILSKKIYLHFSCIK